MIGVSAMGGFMPKIDFWFEFASSYSYPAVMRIDEVATASGVEVNWRPFLLGAVFKALDLPLDSPFNWQQAKGAYMWRDLERVTGALGLEFNRPDPFPQSSVIAARVALVGKHQPWFRDFVAAVYRAEYVKGKNIGEPESIADILTGLGLDAGAIIAEARSDPIKQELRTETDTAIELGIFGAPSFVTEDGELFWGNDRLETAIRWTVEMAA